jgi:hypothetical protein
VAGPRASEDPKIYSATKRVLRGALTFLMIEETQCRKEYEDRKWPQTIEEAVEMLISGLPLKQKSMITRLQENNLYTLHANIGTHIKDTFGLWEGNKHLMSDCRYKTKDKDVHIEDASALIIKELWKELKVTHGLRVLK